ncbi:MAG: hypothetical protein PHT69_02115 [Bacteroidales bacterium]|nr:hypothetical protein [Bacteroidales bacterium]
MIRLLTYQTLGEWEESQQNIVNILKINIRYSGGVQRPDIIMKDGSYAIPFPDLKEHQEKVSHLDWKDYSLSDIKREEI